MSDTYYYRCPSCGSRNRIPGEKIGAVAKCGRCGGQMDTGVLRQSHPLRVTDSDFQTSVLKSPLPVLLDCWAPWCGPCQMVGPILDELAREWQGRIRVAKLNVDENPATASRFHVMSVPTILIFDNGQMKDSIMGAASKLQMVNKMTPYLKT